MSSSLLLQTGKIAASKVENVHPQAVVESCLTCLFLMSKDPANRAIIMEKANVIPTLTDLLPQDRELLQRVAIGALFHLSFEPAFGARLQSETLLGRSMEEHARKLTKIDNEEIGEFIETSLNIVADWWNVAWLHYLSLLLLISAFYASHVMSNLACLREGKIPLPPSNMPQPPQPHHSHQMPPQQQHPHSQQHQAMQQQQHQGMAPQHMQQQGGPGQMMPQDMYRSQVPPQQMQQQQQMMQQQQSLAGGRMPQPGM